MPSLGWTGSCCYMRTPPRKGTCPNFYHSAAHMPSTCLPKSDSPFLSDYLFEGGRLSFLLHGSQVIPAIAPKIGPRCSSVRYYSPWYSMQTNYLVDVDFCILLRPVGGMYWQEMSCLSQSIHNDPNRVVVPGGIVQSHNEIHANILPFPRGYGKGL